jgi:hypothetical protein
MNHNLFTLTERRNYMNNRGYSYTNYSKQKQPRSGGAVF